MGGVLAGAGAVMIIHWIAILRNRGGIKEDYE